MADRVPPTIRRDPEMRGHHDNNFLPNKSHYPCRPSEAHKAASPQSDSDPYAQGNPQYSYAMGLEPKVNDGYNNNNGLDYWERQNNFGAAQNYNSDGPEEDGCDCNKCLREMRCGHVGNLVAWVIIIGILVAYMFCNIVIFEGIGRTYNWLNCLAYAFLGLPLVSLAAAGLVSVVANTQGSYDEVLCFPTRFKDLRNKSIIIAIIGFVFFFACGLPLSMFVGQERAIQHYLQPEHSQDVDCYLRPQKKYEHGKVHFVFLNERDWEWNCSSTGKIQAADGRNYTVDTAPKKARMGTEESHYFYVSNLFYTGRPQWNCPYPIFAACYSTSSSKTCESLKSDQNCWKGPPVGISLRVMNQNEQFFKNWMNENDKDAEAFIRENIDRKMYAEPWRNHGPLVTYGGDHPLDFEEKLKSVRSKLKAIRICVYVLWSVLLVAWCIDPNMTIIILLLACVTCNC